MKVHKHVNETETLGSGSSLNPSLTPGEADSNTTRIQSINPGQLLSKTDIL
jgi:hypothetical protein